MILLNANVLVYAANAAAPQFSVSNAIIQASLTRQLPVVLVPQVLMEFLSIVANQRRTSRPLEPVDALGQLSTLRARVPVLDIRASALDLLGRAYAFSEAAGKPFVVSLVEP